MSVQAMDIALIIKKMRGWCLVMMEGEVKLQQGWADYSQGEGDIGWTSMTNTKTVEHGNSN